MAKELPYFKFNAAEWISGEITLEDLATQGAFINICAFYWFKSGCLTLSEIKRRLKLKQATIDKLIAGNHIKVDDDRVEISFLQIQFDERGHISQRNSENGRKGGMAISHEEHVANGRKGGMATARKNAENAANDAFDGANAGATLFGDLRVRKTKSQKLQHRNLTFRKVGHWPAGLKVVARNQITRITQNRFDCLN